MPSSSRPARTRARWAAHGLVEVVGDARRALGDGPALGPLAVEHPQRIGPVALTVLVAQLVGVGLEIGEQGGSRRRLGIRHTPWS